MILCDLRNLHRGPDDKITTLKTLFKKKGKGQRRKAKGKNRRAKSQHDEISAEAFFALMLGKPVPPEALS